MCSVHQTHMAERCAEYAVKSGFGTHSSLFFLVAMVRAATSSPEFDHQKCVAFLHSNSSMKNFAALVCHSASQFPPAFVPPSMRLAQPMQSLVVATPVLGHALVRCGLLSCLHARNPATPDAGSTFLDLRPCPPFVCPVTHVFLRTLFIGHILTEPVVIVPTVFSAVVKDLFSV